VNDDNEPVTVVLSREEARALADHPATLAPDDPKLIWVMNVKRAVAKLRTALDGSRE
jgi:hypothetical protein